MLTRVYSAAIQGVDAVEVEVEVNTGPGGPKVVIVEPIFTFAACANKIFCKVLVGEVL